MIQFKQLIIDEAEVVDDEVEQQLKQLLTDDEDEVDDEVTVILVRTYLPMLQLIIRQLLNLILIILTILILLKFVRSNVIVVILET
jgi:hypothetical protein